MSKLSQVPVPSLRPVGGAVPPARGSSSASLFGAPIGDLGWFATLLMSFATGFAAFFAATFVGIMSILVYNAAGHHTLDFSLSYRRIGLPIGAVVAVLALSYLGSLWIRRQLRRS